MPIHRQRLYSGLLFIAIGLVFGLGAVRNYPIGTASHMGPGYFPLLLSIVLTLLGIGTLIEGLKLSADAEPAPADAPRYAWRPVFLVLLANAAFAVLLKGVPALGIPAQGLVVSTYAVVLIASLGGEEHHWGHALVLATVLAASCYFVFIRAMGLIVPAWPSYL